MTVAMPAGMAIAVHTVPVVMADAAMAAAAAMDAAMTAATAALALVGLPLGPLL